MNATKAEDLPQLAVCSWCGAAGMWVIEDHHWVLKNKDGSKHVHQPPKHEN